MSALNQLKKRVLKEYHWRASKKEFLERLHKIDSLEAMVDLPWSYQGAGFYGPFAPSQITEEITELIKRVQALEPQVILEVGTFSGLTLFYWSQCSPKLKHLISIDMAAGDISFRRRLFSLFLANQPETKLDLLLANSQIVETRDRVKALLQEKPVDFLFIDADHRYEGVKADYELYGPLVRSGGLIAFHDIRPKDKTHVYGLWEEIRATGTQTSEIITDENLWGIGVMTVE